MCSAQTAPTKPKEGPILTAASLQIQQILPNVLYAYSLCSSLELGSCWWFFFFWFVLILPQISRHEMHAPNETTYKCGLNEHDLKNQI